MTNRLAHETSPYLQQHADNPVNWFPWGEEAFEEARKTEKPILLSIGYAACHWCHVMAHESFENPDVARVMNEHFINIKVDREERPDLDQIYQTAHTVITRRNGGWPLTMFLTPGQVPFAGGTYFPRQPRFGLPGFVQVLEQIRDFFQERRSELEGTEHPIIRYLGQTNPTASEGEVSLDLTPVAALISSLKTRFDPEHGGFGGAPKFPHPVDLSFCTAQYRKEGDRTALEMARLTMLRMRAGGIWDHIGGGFSRYSVDDQWMIPHFEKMLYDNGLLLQALGELYRETREEIFRRTSDELVEWLFREMTSSEGAFFSSLDADSEGEEGRFYVWRPEWVKEVLSDGEYRVASEYFGLTGPPNFENQDWHLRQVVSVDELAQRFRLSPEEIEERIQSSRQKLLKARSSRIRPGLDNKILTSWNALAIRGLISSARILDRPDWIRAAQGAIDFIREKMWRNGQLQAVWKPNNAPLPGYLDDYAFLLAAVMESIKADFRQSDLDFAIEIGDALLAEFEDPAQGGFFFTGHHHEKLIHRPKSGHDNALPSGNGVAAKSLTLLGHLTGKLPYVVAAEKTLRLFFPQMKEQAPGFTSLIMALEAYSSPPPIVIIGGSDASRWKKNLEKDLNPDRIVVAFSGNTQSLPEGMRKPFVSGKTQAWICLGSICLPPVTSEEELESKLRTPSSVNGHGSGVFL
ncbi:MAG: thioredoxin domain-containing protein [Leptospirales bacterium]